MRQPDVLFLMTDQFRFDAIAALGNTQIHTPNLDRLAARGFVMEQAYSACPVCVAARINIRTGCDPHTTGSYCNDRPDLVEGQLENAEARCGDFLARRMGQLGYRTFGVGKFHSYDKELGYGVYLPSEEIWWGEDSRQGDAYARYLSQFPEYAHIEQLHGERTEMYYMPQASPFPAEMTVEAWAADHTIEQIRAADERPYFGFCSFIGPHPPFAPPVPFNRLYNPDDMPDPVCGPDEIDTADPTLPWMNRLIWADDVSPMLARTLKARYYGEITYIDWCIGKILDAIEQTDRGDNTLIVFMADHGDHMGDHHAWQKESFFEASTHIPMLISWPEQLAAGQRCGALASLTDLFGLATSAAGGPELRDGCDLLGVLKGQASPREFMAGFHGSPGTERFKTMIRQDRWKYIFIANGGVELLFDLEADPQEHVNLATSRPELLAELRGVSVAHCASHANTARALNASGDDFIHFPRKAYTSNRINQMAHDLGVREFSQDPAQTIESYFG